MLDLRPNCQLCDRDLPPDAPDARICSYECTYCAHCVDTVLRDVCPTCGGNFTPRPVRPRQSYRPGKALGLMHHPASAHRHHLGLSADDIAAFSARLAAVPPGHR